MSGNRIDIEELLKEQDNPALLATVEALEGENDSVKVTPWTRAAGCLCHLAINVKKASLEGVSPTLDTHVCCGKTLKVVELHFKKDETIGLSDLFQQMHARATNPAPLEDQPSPSSLASGYGHPHQRYQHSHFPRPVDRFDEPECLTRYFSCISDPPPGADYRSWVCECRNMYKVCSRHGILELCPSPRS
jgi:hypothetical protein